MKKVQIELRLTLYKLMISVRAYSPSIKIMSSSLIKFVKSHRKSHMPRNRFEISPEYFKVPIKVRLSSIVSVSSTASVVESTPIILGYLHVNFMPGSKSSCKVISSTSRRRRFPPLLPVII